MTTVIIKINKFSATWKGKWPFCGKKKEHEQFIMQNAKINTVQ